MSTWTLSENIDRLRDAIRQCQTEQQPIGVMMDSQLVEVRPSSEHPEGVVLLIHPRGVEELPKAVDPHPPLSRMIADLKLPGGSFGGPPVHTPIPPLDLSALYSVDTPPNRQDRRREDREARIKGKEKARKQKSAQKRARRRNR